MPPLTPAVDDANRDAELKRAKKNPEQFGTDIPYIADMPLDKDIPNGGLVSESTAVDNNPAADQAVDTSWTAYLSQPAEAIIAELATLTDEQLAALHAAEIADKNRADLISAVYTEAVARTGKGKKQSGILSKLFSK